MALAPEVGFSAADLLAIAGVFLLIGILAVAKQLVKALFSPINISIKFIGHPFGGIVNDVESSLLGWLDGAIAALQHTATDLLHSFVWVWQKTAQVTEDLATDLYDTYDHIVTRDIPAGVEAAIKDVRNAATGAASSVSALEHRLVTDVTNVGHDITDTLDKAEKYADSAVSTAHRAISTEISHAVSSAELTLGNLLGTSVTTLNNRIKQVEGSIASVVQPIVNKAVSSITLPATETAQDVQKAITDAFTGELAATGDVAQAIHSAVNSAVATIKPVVQNITNVTQQVTGVSVDDIASQISSAISSAVAAGGTIDNDIQSAVHAAVTAAITGVAVPPIDLSGITTPIQDLLDKIKAADIPTLATAIAGVVSTVAVLESEAGLGDPACRAKNKAICGTDASAWQGLLAGLVTGGFLLSLSQLYPFAQELTNGMSKGMKTFE